MPEDNKPVIICIALASWEGNYTKSTVQMMSFLAQTYHILYIDYPYTWKDVLLGIWGKRKVPYKKILGIEQRLRKVNTANNAQLHLLHPFPVFPVNWISNSRLYHFALRINSKIVEKSIRQSMAALNIQNPVVVNALNPFYGIYNIGKFNERKRIYYCYDEISAAQWIGKHGQKIEETYLTQVDITITSSHALKEKKRKISPNCYTITNGVDFERFHKCFESGAKREKRERNVVGYVGSIDDRLDGNLLKFLIENAPGLEFRFVGRVINHKLVRSLEAYANVVFIAPVPYLDLPEKIKEFDVCIIPFVKNEFTAQIYPMKINEYLAVGKPVVMTDFAPLYEFENVVKVATNPSSFLGSLYGEIAENNSEKEDERINIASANAWPLKAQKFASLISN